MLEMFNKQQKYLALINRGETALRRVMKIPNEFKIYTMPGGQALQIAAIPLNLLGQKNTATYLNTGYWSDRAIEEAKKYVENINITSSLSLVLGESKINVINSEPFNHNSAYIHYVSDEPVEGIALNNQP